MSSTHDLTAKQKLLIRLSNFLQKYRQIFLYTLIGLAVLIIGLTVYVEWQKHVVRQSTLLVEQAEEAYDAWLASEPDARAEAAGAVREDLDSIILKHKNRYAGQRAWFLRASLAATLENWEEASADYLRVAEEFPNSYLASLSLFNAGVAYEEMGNTDEAIKAYERILSTYPATAPEVPHAIFSLGRISEGKDDFEGAGEAYNRLLSEFPGSSWTNVARNRLIILSARGSLTLN